MNKNTFNPNRVGFGFDCFVFGLGAALIYFGFFGACLVSIGG